MGDSSAQAYPKWLLLVSTTPCSASRMPRSPSSSTPRSSEWSWSTSRTAATSPTTSSLSPRRARSLSAEEKADRKFMREGILELCHNWGTESDPEFKGYANGNEEPGRGFGPIAVSVDDVQAECDRLEKLGVEFKKRPQDGKMKHISFIYDPDRYWIEIVPNGGMKGEKGM